MSNAVKKQDTSLDDKFLADMSSKMSKNYEKRQTIVDALQAFDKDLQIVYNKAEKDCAKIEKLETLNATAVSLIINEIVKLRLSFNKINTGEDDLKTDLSSLRKHIFKVCNDGVTPKSDSALYKTIQRGCIMGAITETHGKHVKRAVEKEEKLGTDAEGKSIIIKVDKLDKKGNPIYDGNILAPRNVVHPVRRRKDENNKWESIEETSTDLVKVPLGLVQNVNSHYNPPVVKGPDGEKALDKQKNTATATQILSDFAHKVSDVKTYHIGSFSKSQLQLMLAVHNFRPAEEIKEALENPTAVAF